MMKTILLLVLAYLLGSIPSGLWIGKAFFNINLREHGSGNTGTTNTFRILGTKAGLIVFAVDFLKGTLAVLLPTIFGVSGISPMVFGLLAVIGHTFPIFAGFKGGKAVATSAGVLIGFSPLFLFILAIYFFAILASIGVLILPLTGWILPSYDLIFTLIVLALATLIIIRHKDNIKRILNKNENIISWGKNITHQKQKD